MLVGTEMTLGPYDMVAYALMKKKDSASGDWDALLVVGPMSGSSKSLSRSNSKR